MTGRKPGTVYYLFMKMQCTGGFSSALIHSQPSKEYSHY